MIAALWLGGDVLAKAPAFAHVVLHAVSENLDLTNTGFNPHRFGDIKNVFSGPQIKSP